MSRGTLDEKNLSLFIREQNKDLSVRKSIKVKLPIRQHIKLHALKLFTENNISETVERALDVYFQQMGDGDASPGDAGGAPGATFELDVEAGEVEGTALAAAGGR